MEDQQKFGESEIFLQRGSQIMDTISEIQGRDDAVKEIENNLIQLHQVFLDMAAFVEAQGQQLNNIESHVTLTNSFETRLKATRRREHQRS